MVEKICPKCGRVLEEYKFYSYREKNDKKYPICKDCIRMDINDYDSDTFVKYLKEFNDPWSPTLWNSMLKKQQKRKKEEKRCCQYCNTHRASILGKYLSYVRLKGFQGYTWKTSYQFEQYWQWALNN